MTNPKKNAWKSHAEALRVIGGKLRMNLNDAATLYPEHFNLGGILQLIAQWDAAVKKEVELLCSLPTQSNGVDEGQTPEFCIYHGLKQPCSKCAAKVPGPQPTPKYCSHCGEQKRRTEWA